MACKGQWQFVSFYCNNRKYSFLVDTGASVSIIKKNGLPDSMRICNNITTINGIGGQINSLGNVTLKLVTENNDTFSHKFHVFQNLPIQATGILGLDFLSTYGCNIDLATNVLVVNNAGKLIYLPISPRLDLTFANNNCLVLPARSESTHFVELSTDTEEDCVVCSREIDKDIFLAGAIVRPKNRRIPIKILNIRDKEIRLQNLEPEVKFLSEYDIFSFDKIIANANRAETLLSLLKLNHLNTEEKSSLETICTKYSDVFFLPGDKLATTNVYEQSITLKPNVNPTYVKPYRLPQSQKPEIDRQIKQMLKDDIIEESSSEWNSPVLLVPKKSESSKKWRLVVDYRKLNDVISRR